MIRTALIIFILFNFSHSFAENTTFMSKKLWEKPYIGFELGVADSEARNTEGKSLTYNSWDGDVGKYKDSNGLIGIQVGKNWLISNSRWLSGIEISFKRLFIEDNKQLPYYVGRSNRIDDSIAETSDGNYLSLSAKLGYLHRDDIFLYGKAGLVQTTIKQKFTDINNVGCYLTDIKKTKNKDGYLLGAGIEYMLKNNLSIKAEYNYSRLGKDASHGLCRGTDPHTFENHLKINSYHFGLNYYF